MQHTSTIFSQLLAKIPRHKFNEVVTRYKGDKRADSMTVGRSFSPCFMVNFVGVVRFEKSRYHGKANVINITM